MRTILILEQGHEKMSILGSDMYKLLLGKGARVLDLMKTPPGHLTLKVDEYGSATEDKSRFLLLPRPILIARMPRCSRKRQLAQR
eukprot:8493877-Pyramimonas_sp.AAC.1